MSRLTRDGIAEPVSRDQILRRKRGQGNINFPCSADHVQDWQPYPVDPYSCYVCDHTYIQAPGVSFADGMAFFSGVTFVLFWFVFVSMLSLKPRPFVQSSFDMQASR